MDEELDGPRLPRCSTNQDRNHQRLGRGQRASLSFVVPSHLDCTDLRVVVSGYYLPLQ